MGFSSRQQSRDLEIRHVEPRFPAAFPTVVWDKSHFSHPGRRCSGVPGRGLPQSGLCGSVGASVGVRAVLGHPPSRSPSGCTFTSGAVSPYEASLRIGRTGLNRPTSELVSIWWLRAENVKSTNSTEKHPVAKGRPGRQALSFIFLVCSLCAKGLVRTLRNKQNISVL